MIGGWLTVNLGWRWVFFVSVPFAVVAYRHAGLVRPRAGGAPGVAPIDWAGAGLLTAGLSSLLLVVLDGASLGLTTGLILLAADAGLAGRASWSASSARPTRSCPWT